MHVISSMMQRKQAKSVVQTRHCRYGRRNRGTELEPSVAWPTRDAASPTHRLTAADPELSGASRRAIRSWQGDTRKCRRL